MNIKLYKVPIGSTWIKRKGPVLKEKNCIGDWGTIDEVMEFINQAEGRDVMGYDRPSDTYFFDEGDEVTCNLTLEEMVEKYNDFNETSRLTFCHMDDMLERLEKAEESKEVLDDLCEKVIDIHEKKGFIVLGDAGSTGLEEACRERDIKIDPDGVLTDDALKNLNGLFSKACGFTEHWSPTHFWNGDMVTLTEFRSDDLAEWLKKNVAELEEQIELERETPTTQ